VFASSTPSAGNPPNQLSTTPTARVFKEYDVRLIRSGLLNGNQCIAMRSEGDGRAVVVVVVVVDLIKDVLEPARPSYARRDHGGPAGKTGSLRQREKE